MAPKSQHKYQGPCRVGGRYPAHQGSTTGNDQADAISKAKTIEEFVAPVFNFPFTATYIKELELSDIEDSLDLDAEITTQTKTQDRKYRNGENQIQNSYVTVALSWDQKSQIRQEKYDGQNQNFFAAWEKRTPIQEPFNDVGGFAFESGDRPQGEGYCWIARSRGCRFHIPH